MTLGKRHFFAHRGRCWRTLGLASLSASVMVGVVMPVADFGHRWAEQGITPAVVADREPFFPVALAQTAITDPEIDQYANAVLQMEPARNETYTQVANLLLAANIDLNRVNLGCAHSNLSAAPRSLRQEVEVLRVGYCNQARDIVDQNGLTAQRFNEITAAHSEDAALAERIGQALVRLQQQ